MKLVEDNKPYLHFLQEMKQAIVKSRYTAATLANREQLQLYLLIGRQLDEKISTQQWGAKVLETISFDLQKLIPGLKGFSTRNLKNMRQFFTAYQHTQFGQLPTAQTPNTLENNHFFGISFTHHLILLNKCRQVEERMFYMEKAATLFWSVAILEHQVATDLYAKKGTLPHNFNESLPKQLLPAVSDVFHDEYLLNYLNLKGIESEREVENRIVANIREFILRMGKGFSFIGNQFRIEVSGEEFYIDLLFFNRQIQCLVAFELKQGKFKPEYAGQLNFYLNILDEYVKLPHENNSIGIILCKEKNNAVVEFSIKTMNTAMGVATYRLSKEVPKQLSDCLPSIEEITKLLD